MGGGRETSLSTEIGDRAEWNRVEKMTLWSRLGDWVRLSRRSLGWRDESVSDDDPSVGVVNDPPDDGRRNGRDGDNAQPWYRRGLRSRVAEVGLETQRIAELLEAISSRIDRQQENAQSTHRAVDRLATALSTVHDVMRAHADLLATVQRRLDADAPALKQIQDGLSKIAAIRETLLETMNATARWAEASQKSDEALGAGLERVRQSVGQLGDASSAGLRSLDAVRTDLRDRFDDLTATVSGLNKRVLLFASSAAVLALLALIVGVIALLR